VDLARVLPDRAPVAPAARAPAAEIQPILRLLARTLLRLPPGVAHSCSSESHHRSDSAYRVPGRGARHGPANAFMACIERIPGVHLTYRAMKDARGYDVVRAWETPCARLVTSTLRILVPRVPARRGARGAARAGVGHDTGGAGPRATRGPCSSTFSARGRHGAGTAPARIPADTPDGGLHPALRHRRRRRPGHAGRAGVRAHDPASGLLASARARPRPPPSTPVSPLAPASTARTGDWTGSCPGSARRSPRCSRTC
jgi:hypothetical protein